MSQPLELSSEFEPRDLADFILRWNEYRDLADVVLSRARDDPREAMVIEWLIRLAERAGPQDVLEPVKGRPS